MFPSSEIYGGINACWDYGPLGVRLKNNVKRLWWHAMTQMRDDIEGLDAAILMHPRVWEASGHVENFTDPLVDCKKCKARFRADELPADPTDPNNPPPLRHHGTMTEPRLFNLMFKTFMGPVEDDASVIYLRPETAQGIYVNFDNVRVAEPQKIPFGIAQIGKAFRNEITPGNFIFRTREFEQMEMQFFVKPGTDMEWFEHWKTERMQWYLEDVGLRTEKLRFHAHGKDELAHYARAAFDIEYEFPFGWKELEGIHNRSDFDLGRHQEYSGKKLEYFDEETKEHYLPYIIETSAGCDRTLLTSLVDAYREDEVEGETRGPALLEPRSRPDQGRRLPAREADGMPEVAQRIVAELARFYTFYDEAGSVGKRYRRMDEVGTPFCITVDSETLQNESVTVRDRDTLTQDRVAIRDLRDWLGGKFKLR